MPKSPEASDATEQTPPFPDAVKITVTKFGAGKVSSGEHVAGNGDIYLDRGEQAWVDAKTAQALEACGFAETA